MSSINYLTIAKNSSSECTSLSDPTSYSTVPFSNTSHQSSITWKLFHCTPKSPPPSLAQSKAPSALAQASFSPVLIEKCGLAMKHSQECRSPMCLRLK